MKKHPKAHIVTRIHLYYAMVVNPSWSYRELLEGICERLSDTMLKYIDKHGEPYSELVKHGFIQNEIIRRNVLGGERIYEDR